MIPKYTHINIHYNNTNDNFTMSYTKNNIPHNSNITRDILNTILPFLSADLDQDIIISNIRIPAIRTSYSHLTRDQQRIIDQKRIIDGDIWDNQSNINRVNYIIDVYELSRDETTYIPDLEFDTLNV